MYIEINNNLRIDRVALDALQLGFELIGHAVSMCGEDKDVRLDDPGLVEDGDEQKARARSDESVRVAQRACVCRAAAVADDVVGGGGPHNQAHGAAAQRGDGEPEAVAVVAHLQPGGKEGEDGGSDGKTKSHTTALDDCELRAVGISRNGANHRSVRRIIVCQLNISSLNGSVHAKLFLVQYSRLASGSGW